LEIPNSRLGKGAFLYGNYIIPNSEDLIPGRNYLVPNSNWPIPA
jgi:hypothetical protein